MLPNFLKPVSLWFRARRNARLVKVIDKLHEKMGRPLSVLDVGGSFVFWQTVPNRDKCQITLLNLEESTHFEVDLSEAERARYQTVVGDARDLSRWQDDHFDLVTCNSVLEHVGLWTDVRNAAKELRRVGVRGWVQVPALGFPLEQHTLLPFVHWFSDPIMAWFVYNLRRDLRKWGWDGVRSSTAYIRPLAKMELRSLFPKAKIWTEWLAIFPKSHVAEW
jgi:ubiquinone/menaquinone biosynthesis C-methylase UbiE